MRTRRLMHVLADWHHIAFAVLALLGTGSVAVPAPREGSPQGAGLRSPVSRSGSVVRGLSSVASVPAASPRLRYLGQFTPHPYPTPGEDVLFKQEFDSALEIERSGCRRSSGPTANYLDASVAKASLGDGYFYSAIRNTGPDAGEVVPQDGLVPSDEFTVVAKIGNFSTADFAAAPYPGPQTLLALAGIALVRNPANSLTTVNFYTGQVCTLVPPPWPHAAWRTATLWWRRDPPAMELMLDDDYAGRAVSAPPRTPWDGRPFSGKDDGLAIAASPHPHSFHVSDTTVYRWWRTYKGHDFRHGPVLSVDASGNQGEWAPSLGGCLALYEGFEKTPEGPPQSPIRDQQFRLVFDEARVRSVRVAGLMNMPTITGAYPNYRYDWTVLDAKLDTLFAGRPELRAILNLDYCPAILVPSGGSATSPPTSSEHFAGIASDVVGHVSARYPGRVLHFAGWNEPDLAHYFKGTLPQAYELWKTTQLRLMADFPGDPTRWLGTPEYAYLAGHKDFAARLASEPAGLRASVGAIEFHTFKQSFTEIVKDLKDLRTAYRNAGVAGTVPINITEHNLSLAHLHEGKMPLSWYASQPNHFTSIYSGAHAFALICEAISADPHVSMTGFSAIGTNAFYWSEPALATSDAHPKPMPTLSVLAMVAKLSGTRVGAVSNWPNLRALATRDARGKVAVVYGSYRPYRGYAGRFPFELQWAGLPNRFTWRHWQIDPTCQDDRMRLVGTGTDRDLPVAAEIGNLGVGCFEVAPTR